MAGEEAPQVPPVPTQPRESVRIKNTDQHLGSGRRAQISAAEAAKRLQAQAQQTMAAELARGDQADLNKIRRQINNAAQVRRQSRNS